MLIDEIQEVEPIQNPWLPDNKDAKITFVDVLIGLMHKKNVDVYVTGSNSKMLSKDVMTQFRDRGDEIHVNPLTYKEFYGSFQGDRRDAWGAFCTFGGLPKVATEETDEDRTAYLQDLMARTYLRDVVERNRIQKDEALLRELLLVVASSVGSLTNPKKLEQTFQSVKNQKLTDDTISRYLDYCEEAYLIKKAFRYDIKGRKYIGTPLKYYFTDVGLRNALLNFRQSEENHLMENIIFNELCEVSVSMWVLWNTTIKMRKARANAGRWRWILLSTRLASAITFNRHSPFPTMRNASRRQTRSGVSVTLTSGLSFSVICICHITMRTASTTLAWRISCSDTLMKCKPNVGAVAWVG